MIVLETAGFLLAYLFTGYSFGKILNKEYRNSTPTENLSQFGRFKRLLLFPILYHNWNKREDIHNQAREHPPSIREMTCCKYINTLYQTSYQQQEKYCKLMSLLWPMPLITNLIMGGCQIILATLYFSFNALLSVPKTTAGVLQTSVQTFTQKFLPLTNNQEINTIKSFTLVELPEKEKKLTELLEAGKKQKEELRLSRSEWRLTGSVNDSITQIIGVVSSTIDEELTRGENTQQKISELLEEIRKKKTMLGNALKILSQCEKTTHLRLRITIKNKDKFIEEDAVAVLISETLASAKTAMQEVKTLQI